MTLGHEYFSCSFIMTFHPTNNPVFWKATADNLLAEERYEKAAEAYLRLTELLPNDPDGWKGRGTALLCMESHGNAVSAFERTLILLPDDKDSLEKLAVCFDKLGAAEKRAACLLRLTEL
ncbi:MAG TPA: hypothetical protein O0W87_00125 [Methanocorpusculum sp.]|nr:hypothetical protein [Methanocorpusculum sp.]HJJ50614.1 hypothetical protein [Methanocorpusculum sp.]